MKTLLEICENHFTPFAELRDVINEGETNSIDLAKIKQFIQDNYYIDSGGKKQKSLPLKCFKIDKSTGDVIINAGTRVYFNSKSNKFTDGFKIIKIEGDLYIQYNQNKKIGGKIEEITGRLSYYNCEYLTTLKGAPKKADTVYIYELPMLGTLDGMPKVISNDENSILICECPQLKSYGNMSEDMIKKIVYKEWKQGSLQKTEIPIDKWKKTMHVDMYPGDSNSLLSIEPDTPTTIKFPKSEAAELMVKYCKWSIEEEKINFLGINNGVIEIELHEHGVKDHIDYQHLRRCLKFSKGVDLSKLVDKLRILNYVDNIDIEDNGDSIKDFEKVFVNANPWRIRVLGNNVIKNLSCLNALSNTPVRRIYIGECNNITSLKGCPKEISLHLYIEKCPKLSDFGCQLPDKIKWVRVIHCPKFTSLEGCPKEMEGLECYATGIKSFEGGIEKLENLDAHNCPNLVSFEGLPEHVFYIIVNKCSKLNSLNGIPKIIKNLSIKGTKLGPFKNKRDLVPYCEIHGKLSQ